MSTRTNVALAALEHGVDRVARRAGHLRDDHPLLAEQRVQQARLADVRPARGSRRGSPPRPTSPRRLPGSCVDDRVEQVAGAVPVERRERDRVAEPEPVELERVHVAARVVDLVREQEDRLARAAQDPASSSSPGVMPGRASTTKRTRSASAIAARAWSAIARVIGDGSAMSTPPVSIEQELACRSTRRASSLRSRVTPGVSWTTAARESGQPVDERRLADVREADDRDACRAALPASVSPRSRSRSTASPHRARARRESRPWAARARARRRGTPTGAGSRPGSRRTPRGSPSPFVRQAVEVERLAPGDRHRVEVAEPPELACRGSPPATTGTLSWSATIAAPGFTSPGTPLRCRVPSTKRPSACPRRPPRASAAPPRGRTRRAAPRTCRTRGSAVPRPGMPVQLDLRHVVDGARAGGAERGRVEPGKWLQREHDAALARDALARRRRAAGRTIASTAVPDRQRGRPPDGDRRHVHAGGPRAHELLDRARRRRRSARSVVSIVARVRRPAACWARVALVAEAQVGGERVGADPGPLGLPPARAHAGSATR